MTTKLRRASVFLTPGNAVAEIVPSVKEFDAVSPNQAAKGVMLGMLRGQNEVSGAVLRRISQASEVAVRDIAAVAGDFEAVTTGLVSGAIESATKMGVSREEAAAAAADGALRAADIFGSPAFEAVEKAVTQSIDGVQVVMKKPICNQQVTNRPGVIERSL